MSALWSTASRGLVWFHRWVGVALCLLFAVWFVSGAVLIFVPFPSLSEKDRLEATPALDASRIEVSPEQALSNAPQATSLRLVSVGGRPVYLAGAGETTGAIDAATGQTLPLFANSELREAVRAFAKQEIRALEGPFDYDQWVVHHRFNAARPFYKAQLADAAGTELYISARTGEILQRTTTYERAWNWCGAVVHWLYFTPLRKNWTAWDRTVWSVAFVGLLSSVVGTWLGIDRFLKRRARGRPGFTAFRGWMRWHHVLGLVASAIVLLWIFSGWLSMDHGRLFATPAASSDLVQRLTGMPLQRAAALTPLDQVRSALPAVELKFGSFGGVPYVAAYGAGNPAVRVFEPDRATLASAIPEERLLTTVSEAFSAPATIDESRVGSAELLARAEGVGDGIAALVVSGAHPTRLYVDRATGQIVAVMNESRRAYAWIYYALHTFEFPVLLARPVLRTTLLLLLMSLGFAFSVTGVVIGIRRLRQDLFSTRAPETSVSGAR